VTESKLLAGVVTLLLTATTWAAQPRLDVITPRGGQRGTEVTVRLHGPRLGDAVGVVFHGPGITATDVTREDDNRIKATFVIAPDCRVGLHGVRVHTATGISSLRTFSVGTLAEVAEAEPNNLLDEAQVIELDRTVNGIAANEDVDYYAFEAEAGERVSVEIEGMRLGHTLFDPFVALFDADGFEVAACDDAALLRQDATVAAVLPEAGRYYVQVRESSYRGNGNCRYRLHVGRFARPTATLPSGGRPGETLPVTLLGDPAGDRDVSVTLPDTTLVDGGWVRPDVHGHAIVDEAGTSPSPCWLRVTSLDNFIETEPNDRGDQVNTFAAPAALNGVIGEPGDRDWFQFDAKKGQVFDVTVFARRLGSPLDPIMNIRDKNGRVIVGNDDAGGPDSSFRFTTPEDGTYRIHTRDHLSQGGPDYAYRIEVAPVRARVSLVGPRQRQAVAVPRGNRTAIVLTANRQDFGGPLTITAADLPPGVTMSVVDVHPSVSAVPVVFEATAEAERESALADIQVAHTDTNTGITGRFHQDVELVLGRNRVVFWAHSVDRFPVAVADPAPFTIESETPATPLVRNGTAHLKVVAIRNEGFTAPIKLRVPFTPPGVGASNSTTIAEGQTEVLVPINANRNARLGTWHLVVTGTAGGAAGGGSYVVSTSLIPLEVAEPFVAFKPQGTTVEQGQQTELYIEVTKAAEFEAGGTVELHGLPRGVSAPAVEIGPDTTSLTFDITTTADSPPGRHKSVFCIARLPRGGVPVAHRLPAAEVRIDKPLPPAVAAAKPPPPPPPVAEPAKPDTPKPKPLTRLQKLRKEHAERRKQREEEGQDQ
jgi:hypothetical protein